jgi:hypothetical protein
LIKRAAVCGAIAEDFEARWVAGDEIPLSDYLAACNVQRRLLTAIGLERKARDVNGIIRPREPVSSSIREDLGGLNLEATPS